MVNLFRTKSLSSACLNSIKRVIVKPVDEILEYACDIQRINNGRKKIDAYILHELISHAALFAALLSCYKHALRLADTYKVLGSEITALECRKGELRWRLDEQLEQIESRRQKLDREAKESIEQMLKDDQTYTGVLGLKISKAVQGLREGRPESSTSESVHRDADAKDGSDVNPDAIFTGGSSKAPRMSPLPAVFPTTATNQSELLETDQTEIRQNSNGPRESSGNTWKGMSKQPITVDAIEESIIAVMQSSQEKIPLAQPPEQLAPELPATSKDRDIENANNDESREVREEVLDMAVPDTVYGT
ncbi:hypothetical protein MMC25_003433 [Agyrium rufum]|nr:hypothetical protein [Agyrium rufum]